tara:strand:- start:14836 stop:15951 length:1116 start_codon:yes stop_codon:yes gene_type:complete
MPKKPTIVKKQKKIEHKSIKDFQSKYGGDFKSKGERRYALGKTITQEAEKVSGQIEEESTKAQTKSMWTSIGGALGGLALGLATGGLGLTGIASYAAAAGAAGAGTYLGGHGGKKLAEKETGKRKDIKGDLFYKNTAKEQTEAFKDFDTKLNEGILKKSLYAGALAGISAASGDIIKGLKGLKEKQAVAKSAANQQKFNKMLVETTGSTLPDKVAQAKSGADFIAKADLSAVSTPAAATETVASTSQAIAPESQFGEVMALEKGELAKAEAAFDMKISKSKATEMAADPHFTAEKMQGRYKSAYPKGQSLTPEMDKVVPNLFDNFLTGVKDEATKRATQTVLASGAYGLYQHRPELESLKKFNIIDPRKIV